MTAKFTTIPAGFRITLTTWENDGDHYRDNVTSGNSEERVKFWVDIFKVMRSGSGNDNFVGNIYSPGKTERLKFETIIAAVARKHPAVMSSVFEIEDLEKATDSEIAEQIYDDFHYMGLAGDEFYTRVAARWTIEYIPTEIKIEDVTDKFI